MSMNLRLHLFLYVLRGYAKQAGELIFFGKKPLISPLIVMMKHSKFYQLLLEYGIDLRNEYI